jgi:hypothetical protein
MNHLVNLTLCVSILVPVLGAQTPTYFWSPRGADKNIGGSNNTIPFWGQSASYQQIHDAIDFGVAPVAMKGMAMRPSGNRTLTGRSWDMRITLSHTKVAANAMSSNFSTNLAGANTAIVYGSSTTFNKFSWPTSTSSGSTNPKPVTFTIPFNQTYVYVPALGNLCWDWRHLNASTFAFMAMDATSGSSQQGTILASIGKGCTGSSVAPATATTTNNSIGTSGYIFQSTLSNATSSQPAIMALGATPKSQNLGWCTNLELVPLAFIYGKTDTSGSWTFQAPIAAAAGASAVSIYVQYAYNDPSQATGFGLSNMAGYMTPNIPGGNVVSRLWFVAANSAVNGNELATTGSTGLRYGLVVGWLQ